MASPISNTTPVLKADHISVQFGGLTALDSVSFEVRQGEVLGVIGPNGAGKSTLINVITGIYRATSGHVWFESRRLERLKPHQVARLGVMRTFQNSRLFTELSVLDNVLIGMHRRTRGGVFDAVVRRGRAMRALKEAADEAGEILSSISDELYDRRHTPVGDLPHADKRRVEVARALAAQPKLLLLDEPAAGMGAEETSRFIDDVKRIQQERAELSVMIIEHDMELMRRFPDRVMVLNYGQRIAIGRFEEISEIETVKSAYLGSGG
jgi:branched-chain amino acid transport system ATP-binding protein